MVLCAFCFLFSCTPLRPSHAPLFQPAPRHRCDSPAAPYVPHASHRTLAQHPTHHQREPACNWFFGGTGIRVTVRSLGGRGIGGGWDGDWSEFEFDTLLGLLNIQVR